MEPRPEEGALDRLISELRAEASPKLDWQRVEARLMREPQLQPRSASRSFSSRLRLPAAALLAIAAVLALVMTRRPVPAPAKQLAKLSNAPLNGDQLALGTRVTAGNRPLLVEHPAVRAGHSNHTPPHWSLTPVNF
ncbi:MAG: hypothetical protein WDO74_11725 [Pseudomonadota bacterium]